ncbi:hypothetical protein Tco_1025807 [Tanacetum coccineum]
MYSRSGSFDLYGSQIAYHTSSVPEILDKRNHLFIRGRFNKILVRESRTDQEDLTKYFSINSKLLLIHLELESKIAGREFKNLQSNLKCGFSLWLVELNFHVAFFNLESFLKNN